MASKADPVPSLTASEIECCIVIPGPSEARNPESITPAQGVWIPDSPLRGDPE